MTAAGDWHGAATAGSAEWFGFPGGGAPAIDGTDPSARMGTHGTAAGSSPRLEGALRRLRALVRHRPHLADAVAVAVERIADDLAAGGADGARRAVSLDSHRLTVELGGRRQLLTPTEWRLLRALLSSGGQLLAPDELAERAWGAGYVGRHSQVQVYISRLRRKLGPWGRAVANVRGHGYYLCPQALQDPISGDVGVGSQGPGDVSRSMERRGRRRRRAMFSGAPSGVTEWRQGQVSGGTGDGSPS
jgi:hypothetical protein